jgi:vacuolar-type H+-ATPase subunit I/STV1
MFGDAGHGLLMVAAATTFCIFEKRLSKARKLNEVGCRFCLLAELVILIDHASLYATVLSPLHCAGGFVLNINLESITC